MANTPPVDLNNLGVSSSSERKRFPRALTPEERHLLKISTLEEVEPDYSAPQDHSVPFTPKGEFYFIQTKKSSDTTAQTLEVIGEAVVEELTNTVNILNKGAKEVYEDTTDLFKFIATGKGEYTFTKEPPRPNPEEAAKQKEEEEGAFIKRSLERQEQEGKRVEAAKEEEAAKAAERISEGKMAVGEFVVDNNPNLSKPLQEQIKKLGINHVIAIWGIRQQKIKQVKEQEKEGKKDSFKPVDYFTQANMAGERQGGQHATNAAG